ncbi:hypothetical protein ATANTOWER_001242 [Ataeniobius toweri]|uniref:Uncharacterized protein n=1 Tax=Ataeniobius toweri TaxID=208326 RepID=A0ABU7ACH4_9TELE|nr:hypothetical protein [Ataeniobius toweri]
MCQNVGASPKASSRLEKNTSSFATPPHLLKKSMDTQAGAAEQVSSWVLERPAAPPAVPPKRNSCTFRVKQLRGRELPNDLQGANNMSGELKVKELVRMFSVSVVQQKTAGPKEKPGSEHPQVKLLAQRHSTFPAQETRVRPTVEDREEQQSLILSMHVATVERKNSLLTGRNLQQNQAQCERPSATTDWAFERTEQRHKENTEALVQEYFLWEGKVKCYDVPPLEA